MERSDEDYEECETLQEKIEGYTRELLSLRWDELSLEDHKRILLAIEYNWS